MARDITTAFSNSISATNVRPLVLIKAEFDSGDLRIWTGIGDLTFNAETYTGAGFLLNISPAEETKQLRANNVNFSLSGLTTEIMAIALNERVRGRPITVWFGTFDAVNSLIADPLQYFSGKMDTKEVKTNSNPETGEVTVDLVVSAEGDMQELRKKRPRRYTPEDQKDEFPGDLFLDFVPKIQEKEIIF